MLADVACWLSAGGDHCPGGGGGDQGDLSHICEAADHDDLVAHADLVVHDDLAVCDDLVIRGDYIMTMDIVRTLVHRSRKSSARQSSVRLAPSNSRKIAEMSPGHSLLYSPWIL